MRLYQVAGCPYAHRVRMVLEEKRLSYAVEYFESGARPAPLVQLSEAAKSPTLFDSAHDTWVWDSLVVAEYLEDRYPAVALLPADAGARARARSLMREVDSKLHPCVTAIEEQVVHRKPAPPDEAKVSEALARVHAGLEPWNERLQRQRFLVGDEFTLADIALYTPLFALVGFLGKSGEVPLALSDLRDWYDRVAARPSTGG
jgi:glutathione S-transferase